MQLMATAVATGRLWLLRALFMASFALIPIGVGAVALLFGEDCGSCLALPAVPFVVVGLLLAQARCPRCTRTFFWSWQRGSNPLSANCRHCGLPLRSQPEQSNESVD